MATKSSSKKGSKPTNTLFVNMVTGKIGIIIHNRSTNGYYFYTYNSDEEQDRSGGMNYSTEDVTQQQFNTIYAPLSTTVIQDQILFSVDDAVNNFDTHTKEQLLDMLIEQNQLFDALIDEINNKGCAILMSKELSDKINDNQPSVEEVAPVEVKDVKRERYSEGTSLEGLTYTDYLQWVANFSRDSVKISYSEWMRLMQSHQEVDEINSIDNPLRFNTINESSQMWPKSESLGPFINPKRNVEEAAKVAHALSPDPFDFLDEPDDDYETNDGEFDDEPSVEDVNWERNIINNQLTRESFNVVMNTEHTSTPGNIPMAAFNLNPDKFSKEMKELSKQ